MKHVDCGCARRQKKRATDTVKDSDDVDVGLVLPQRTATAHSTDMLVFQINIKSTVTLIMVVRMQSATLDLRP